MLFMVRDQLSEEIWVELNNLYLFLNSSTFPEKFRSDPENFFRRTIRFSLVFQGLSYATIHHDEGWRFMSLGRYLERSDQTSRVLDTLFNAWRRTDSFGLDWSFASCKVLSAYRRQYQGALSLRNVADFLLFSRDFPRSLTVCCFPNRRTIITRGSHPGIFSNEAERLAGSALAQLNRQELNHYSLMVCTNQSIIYKENL